MVSKNAPTYPIKLEKNRESQDPKMMRLRPGSINKLIEEARIKIRKVSFCIGATRLWNQSPQII